MIRVGVIRLQRSRERERVEALERALGSVSRETWLRGILNGRDLLTPDDLLAQLRADRDYSDTAGRYEKSFRVFLRQRESL